MQFICRWRFLLERLISFQTPNIVSCCHRIPATITATLLLSDQKRTDMIDPFFFYGKSQVTFERNYGWSPFTTVQRSIVWCLCLLFQIICTAVVVALSILLGGSSLVCLSRGSWTRGDQVQDENSTADQVVEVAPERDAQREQLSNTGTYSFCRQAQACYKHSLTCLQKPHR